MELTAYKLRDDVAWPLRPAPRQRAWMDDFTLRWPYRCPPLVMANQAGWEVACPVALEAVWNGGPGLEDLEVTFSDGRSDFWQFQIGSRFGGGILTFSIPYLFRTPEPVGLLVRGPCNSWIDGAAPLDGWVETWGLEAPFTMSWKLTSAGRPVRFREGDPVCLIQPFDLGLMESVRPVLRDLRDEPELSLRFGRWREDRIAFGSTRGPSESQGTYARGEDVNGAPVPGHRQRVSLAPFAGS